MVDINFIFGFLLATVIFAIITGLLYARLFSKSKNIENAQGYLDLIPDLTDAQRRQVMEIRKVFLPKVAKIRENLCKKRLDLAHALFDEPSDMHKIKAIGEQVRNYQTKLENEVINHIIEEKQLLTPPQIRKFYETILDQFSLGSLGIHDVK
jgi:hypothetical protein